MEKTYNEELCFLYEEISLSVEMKVGHVIRIEKHCELEEDKQGHWKT